MAGPQTSWGPGKLSLPLSTGLTGSRKLTIWRMVRCATQLLNYYGFTQLIESARNDLRANINISTVDKLHRDMLLAGD